MKNREQLQEGLNTLKAEYEIGQKMLKQLDDKREILNTALTKTNEAIQRIEEQIHSDD